MKRIIIITLIIACAAYFYKDIKPVFNAWKAPLAGKTIIIDAGHGGFDGGADYEDIHEKSIALSVSEKVRNHLNGQGAIVLMTREDDIDLADPNTKGIRTKKTEDLQKRSRLINHSSADMFISIHLNAIPDPKLRGAQTFYSPNHPDNEKIAGFIQMELTSNMKNTTRTALEIGHVYILNNASMPGALVEIGFLSNPKERLLLKKERYQEKMAAAVSRGILRYFESP